MDIPVIALAAFLVSEFTLYSGFGLGTLLLPLFTFFFPVEVAVAATALVHGDSDFLKVMVVGREADRKMVIRFGLPAILATFAGAAALVLVADFAPVHSNTIGSHPARSSPRSSWPWAR